MQGSKDEKPELSKLLQDVGQVKKLEVSLRAETQLGKTGNDLDVCNWLQLCTS